MKAILLVAFVVALAYGQKIWSLCGSGTLKVNDIVVSPPQPVVGQEMKVVILGVLSQQISSGNAHVLAQYAGVTLFEGDLDLCQFASQYVSCPLNPGPLNITVVQQIPPIAPVGGPYQGYILLTDQTGQNVTCISFDFNMQSPANDRAEIQRPVNDWDIIDHVNNHPEALWRAAPYKHFEGMTAEQFQRRFLGAKLTKTRKNLNPAAYAAKSNAPTSFDWRIVKPNCVHPIRDQQQCGSCWAFAGSEALSDRFCIATNGSINVVLSPQYMVSCDTGDMGCDGGYLSSAWDFLTNTGIPTDACYPYTSGGGDSGECQDTCADGSALKLYKAQSSDSFEGEADIQQEVMTNGPIEVGFSVYRDFMNYKSGVYHHVTGALLGGHAVKIVGWGVDALSNQPYWIIANSWSSSWGQNGFFWMLRGRNECGIESEGVAGKPLVQ